VAATTAASPSSAPEVTRPSLAEAVEPSNAELEHPNSATGNGAKRVGPVEITVKPDVRSPREGAHREGAHREGAHREGAAKRPQPQNKPRSQRKK
jgi:hypothetical protein